MPEFFDMEAVGSREQVNELLAAHIQWHHANHISSTTGLTLLQAVERSMLERSGCRRSAPPLELLDLHLATYHTWVVQEAGEISFR